jgi:quercetin dioxygenase-like cupin family protein
MPTLLGFGTFAALPEERISDKISRRILSGDQGMIVWWSIGAGVHVEPHSHTNEQIVWMLKGKMEFRLGNEQRVCGPGVVFTSTPLIFLDGPPLGARRQLLCAPAFPSK